MGIASERGEKNKFMLKGTSKLDLLKLGWPQFFSPTKWVMLLIEYTKAGEEKTLYCLKQLSPTLRICKKMETIGLQFQIKLRSKVQ